MSDLTLTFLGIPGVERDGRPVALARHKALALLAYLAVTGAPHRRDVLATVFWPELDQTRARAALRRTLSSLHVALSGDWLAISRETIGLAPTPACRLDVAHFRQLLAHCREHGHPEMTPCADCLPLLAEAAVLYRGDFLAGFTLRDAPAFDDWQFFETETLRRELASALERLARGHGQRGEHETAIRFARRWLALDPLHEPAHCQLMRLYAWAGQRQAVLRQYADCVRLLEQELGLPPQASTTGLYTAIKENWLLRQEPDSRPEAAAEAGAISALPRAPAAAAPPATAAYASFGRIARGQMVGREHEWATAVALYQRAAGGEGQALLISGEPGIGKTRLARELAGLAQAAGAVVLVDGCHAEGGPPYAPLAGIIRQTFENRSGPAIPDFIVAELLTLAPQLRSYRPHVAPNPPLGPEFEQQRLFDSFVAWCEIWAASAPLLLLVEDVHWADSGTLALLRHLARRARPARLLLVLTFRDTEVAADLAHPLNAVLLDLNRERLAETMALPRLTLDQTRAQLAALLSTGGEISPEFLESLYQETEGNPFFVEEVCRGLIEQGKLYHAGGVWRRADMQSIFIPSSVRGAILARVERLPAPAQEMLRLAAVIGRDVPLALLRGASDLDEDALGAALARAEQAQLISEGGPAGQLVYTFAHALIPFALRESVNGLRRQRLHRLVGIALERQRPHDVEALAYHFAAAGEGQRAIEYARRAAERAQRSFAYAVARQHLQTALAWTPADGANDLRLALLEELADVHCLHGERAEAIARYQEALRLWAETAGGDRWTAVRLHRKTGDTFNRLAQSSEIERFKAVVPAGLQSALKLIAAEPPHPESVRLLTTMANYAYWEGFELYGQVASAPKQGEQYARAAVQMAERLDAPGEYSAALEALANSYSSQGMLREGIGIVQQRLAVGNDPRLTDPRERVSILSHAGSALCAVGDYAQALAHLLAAERLADELRDWGQVIYTLNKQLQCYFGLDRWDEILQVEEKRLALEARYGRERIGRMCFQCGISAYVHGWRGETELARARRAEAYQMMTDSVPLANWLPIHHY